MKKLILLSIITFSMFSCQQSEIGRYQWSPEGDMVMDTKTGDIYIVSPGVDLGLGDNRELPLYGTIKSN